jgi:surface polysaccharide O-acyltransferase-like enzyme
MKISRELSGALMIANFAATLLVIAIHYSSRYDVDITAGYTWNYLTQEFLINGMARSGVPFFAMISGFFMIGKTGGGKRYVELLRNKFGTTLIPYLLCSGITFLLFIALKMLFLPDRPISLTLPSIANHILISPMSPQLWFLRDLIVLILLSPLIFIRNRFFAPLLGTVLGILWALDIQPAPIVGGLYLVNIETLFYFWLGGFLCMHPAALERLVTSGRTAITGIFTLWLLLVLARVYIDPTLDVWYVKRYTLSSVLLYKAAIAVGIISLIQLSARVRDNRTLIYLSGFTFFAFLFHHVPLSTALTVVSRRVVDAPYAFYFEYPLATIIVFSAAYLTCRFLPPLYAVLTGGRSPDKALRRT